VKRDDLAADPYGGNKVRKLELYLGEALRERRSAVLTFGGVGSNHALATAVHARRVGLNAILLLLPQQKSASVRHHLLAAHAHGAELHLARAIEERAAARPFDARSPYLIPTGGTAPLGDVGLVGAGFELAAQVAAGELPKPDEIWVALGTAGTAAGIALGVAAAGLDTRVVCVRVSSPRYGSFAHLARVFRETRDFLRARDPSFPDVRLDPGRVRVIDDFAAPGYGIPSERGRRARELAKEVAGLELDDTYTAKTFAALHAAARERPGLRVVFYNSYDPRRIAPAGADAQMLPVELRGFAL
jgi:D-cysteine desulfhydrase